jgi:hypothetical protein
MSNVRFLQSTGSATALQFTNVVASSTPEPATYVLIATGLGVIDVVRLRQRRKAVALSRAVE